MEDPSEKYHFAFDEQLHLPIFTTTSTPTIEPSTLIIQADADADAGEDKPNSSSTSRAISGISEQEQEELAKLKSVNRGEYRRQVHLLCEHRRRNMIQTGIQSLEQLIPADVHRQRRLSKVGIISYGVEYIESLHGQLEELMKEQTALQAEHDQLVEQVKNLKKARSRTKLSAG